MSRFTPAEYAAAVDGKLYKIDQDGNQTPIGASYSQAVIRCPICGDFFGAVEDTPTDGSDTQAFVDKLKSAAKSELAEHVASHSW